MKRNQKSDTGCLKLLILAIVVVVLLPIIVPSTIMALVFLGIVKIIFGPQVSI